MPMMWSGKSGAALDDRGDGARLWGLIRGSRRRDRSTSPWNYMRGCANLRQPALSL